jgi:putative NADH-flavin reductase
MNIAVYGATGAIGSKIVEEAVSRGHEVTAISRRGGAVENAAVLAADLTDTAEFIRVAGDHDVVVISAKPATATETYDELIGAHRSLIADKPESRIFVVGGAGSLEIDGIQLQRTPGFPEAYKRGAAAMTEILDVYRASSGIDWTVISPAPEIGPGERTGEYKTALDTPAGERVSREDFAVAILDEIENPKHRQKRFTVAN